MFNLRLIAAGWAALSCLAGAQATAQDAAPVVQAPASAGPVVVELFSSQACAFCPQADRLFSDFIGQQDVIGLACHVDYFDVREGSLSQPFCTQRQTWYLERLHAGPNYTPQMVVQGVFDVTGYKVNDVAAAMQDAALVRTLPIRIHPAKESGAYEAALPADFILTPQLGVFLLAFDKPHELVVSEGRNRGQKMVYENIVSGFSALGPWPEGSKSMTVTPELSAAHKGFALLLQDMATGRIVAAGKFEPAEKKPAETP